MAYFCFTPNHTEFPMVFRLMAAPVPAIWYSFNCFAMDKLKSNISCFPKRDQHHLHIFPFWNKINNCSMFHNMIQLWATRRFQLRLTFLSSRDGGEWRGSDSQFRQTVTIFALVFIQFEANGTVMSHWGGEITRSFRVRLPTSCLVWRTHF